VTDDFSRAVTRLLAQAVRVDTDGTGLALGTRTLALTAILERVEGNPEQTITAAGIRVECAVDGVATPALTAGTVGLDPVPDRALRNAAEDWVMQFGVPIASALTGRGERRLFGGYHVYASPTGIRGQERPDGLGKLHDALFALEPTRLFAAPGLHALTIVIVRKPDAPITGEFRADGQLSDAFRELAMQVPWPPGHYMLKQHYVLAPA